MDIGKLIESRRKELGYTLEEIGAHVGVAKGTVGKWVNGNISNMGRDKIARLSEILDVSPLVFIYDDISKIQKLSTVALTDSSLNFLTVHENTVITAYREQPAMQPAVDRLLGVAEGSPRSVASGSNAPPAPHLVRNAAQGGGSDDVVTSLTANEAKNLKNTKNKPFEMPPISEKNAKNE